MQKLIFIAGIYVSFLNFAWAQSFATGLIIPPPDVYERFREAPTTTRGPLPKSATLEYMFPTARSQGQLGSCTAWATTNVKAYRIFKASPDAGSPDLVRQSPAFVYAALTNQSCNTGTYIHEALQFLKLRGSVSWDNFPYSDKSCPNWQSAEKFASNKSVASYRLGLNPRSVLPQIKAAIADGTPVILAINACSEFQSPPADGVIRATGGDNGCGAHAVVALGYSDELGSIRILNSWGREWGDEGKVWMSYDVFTSRFLQAYVDFGPSDETAPLDVPIWARENSERIPQIAGSLNSSNSKKQGPLTSDILHRSIRSNIAPVKAGKDSTWSIWLNLPEPLEAEISRVEYSFHHPSFINPKIADKTSSIFLASWRGWGCVDDAEVTAFLRTGGAVTVKFNFCTVVARTNGAISRLSASSVQEVSLPRTDEVEENLPLEIPIGPYIENLISGKISLTKNSDSVQVVRLRIYGGQDLARSDRSVTKLEVQGDRISPVEALRMAGVSPKTKIINVSYERARVDGYYICLNSTIKNIRCSNGKAALAIAPDDQGRSFRLDQVIKR